MKIGILGGSFDPIHSGHIAMAKQAMLQLSLDEVWFLPSSKTPLKNRDLTEDVHRKNMILISLKKYPKFKLNTLEMDRKGMSYTIDTVRYLRRQYPEDEFYWMIGNDQLKQFHLWKNAQEICEQVHMVCFNRDYQIHKTEFKVQCLQMKDVLVSSSEIRKGNKLNYLEEGVLEYIYQHRLYVENFVQSRVKPKRFAHSVSVARLCEELAICHHLDVQKAYYIGLFHDIAKSMTVSEMEPWMDIICPENKSYAPAVWHGFVGSEIVDRVFEMHDGQIKNAIYHHVLGTSRDPYAMIIFCADKLDPLRDYDTSYGIELCKQDLKQGFEYELMENKKYLEGN